MAAVDSAKDRIDYDKVARILQETDEDGVNISRVQWLLYDQLYNRGCRIERAVHEIARMAPRLQK